MVAVFLTAVCALANTRWSNGARICQARLYAQSCPELTVHVQAQEEISYAAVKPALKDRRLGFGGARNPESASLAVRTKRKVRRV